MIALNTKEDMTSEQKYYVSGLADALELIESSVADNLIIGNKYFVILYKDGDIYKPYVREMKLYKITQGAVKSSYCFTFNLEKGRYKNNTPDLVLASKKGLTERVFFTEEQALKKIE
jgi:hypothetical protein